MIDTIALTLNSDMFRITNPDKFAPSARWVMHTGSWAHGIRSKQNPTKYELMRGIYKPRLTLSPLFDQSSPRLRRAGKNKKIVAMLKIELSLPKLLFGNNFQELRYSDFRPCLDKLMGALASMGVAITSTALENAPVSSIHYSKNIPLTDGSTPYHYINKIKQANVKLSLDVNQTDYRNDGYSYRWHCNSYELIFYDKIRDLQTAYKSNKRALEKDSALQMHLFEKFKKRNKFEILRMELRLNKRQKIKQLFGKLGIKANLTFKKLFKPAIAKKVLLHYLDEIESARPPLLDYKPHDDKQLFSTLLVHNPHMRPTRIVQIYGLKKLLAVYTLRELRTMIGRSGSWPASRSFSAGWARLINEAKDVKLPTVNHTFSDIRKCIQQFKTIQLNTKASHEKDIATHHPHAPSHFSNGG